MDSLPTEIIANIIRFLPLDEKHIVQTVNRKWQDASSFAIRKQVRLDLTYKRRSNSETLIKKIARAVQMDKLPDFAAVRFLKVKEPKSPETHAAVTAVLQKVWPTVQHLVISYRQMSQKKWLLQIFDRHVFPELRSLRAPHVPVEVVPTMLAVCPKLLSFNAYQMKLLALLPAGTRQLEIERLKHDLSRRHIARFKDRLMLLAIRNSKLRPSRSFFAGLAYLRVLEVTATFCLSDNMINNLAKECPVLQQLSLRNMNANHYVHPDSSRCSLTGASITHLNRMQALQNLVIESPQWNADLSDWECLRMNRPGGKRLIVRLVKGKTPAFPGVMKWIGPGDVNLEMRYLSKKVLWSLFAKIRTIRKLTLNNKEYDAPEDTITVLCAMFRDSLEELTLSKFEVSDDLLCILCSTKVKKLIIKSCACCFTAKPLLTFLKAKTDDGTLKHLSIETDHFPYSLEEAQTFTKLLSRFEPGKVTIVMKCPIGGNVPDDIRITNFDEFFADDTELGLVRDKEMTEWSNNPSADTSSPRLPPLRQTRKVLGERKTLLDKLMMVHTNLTKISIGMYYCSLKYIIQNRGLRELDFGGAIDDNDMIGLSGLQHLEELTLSSVVSVKVTAAGIMLLLMGKSSHCIKCITFDAKFSKKLTQDGLLTIRDEVVRINESRSEGQKLALILPDEYNESPGDDNDYEPDDDDDDNDDEIMLGF